jgi:LuxR family quorum sensing-dependent transcriptional regulator
MGSLRDLTFGYIDASRVAGTKEALLAETMKAVEIFEIEGVIVADLPGPAESFDPIVLMSGWSLDWVNRYTGHQYVHFDPVAKALQHRCAPYLWSEVCNRRLEPEERMVMGEAAEHGLASGISVPIYDVNGKHSCVSFSGHHLNIDEERRGALQLIGFYAHHRLRELGQRSRRCLSERERECLTWAAKGKTGWETSRILDISEETAREYVLSAARKLGTQNKVQTVAEAIRRGEIG